MHKCTNAPMHKCTNAQMHKCTNTQIHKYINKCDNALICDISGETFSISDQSYYRKLITRKFDIFLYLEQS